MKNKQKTLTEQMLYALIPARILLALLNNATTFLNSMLTGALLNADAVAAVSFVQPAILAVNMLGGGLSTGTATLCSRYVGRGDMDSARGMVSLSLFFSAVSGALFFVLFRFFSLPIASFLGATGQDLENAAEYLRGLSYGMGLVLFSSCVTTFLQLDNSSRTATVGSIVFLSVNVIFIFLFVSVFKMGLRGVGLATVTGYLAMALVVLFRYLSGKLTLKPNLSDLHLKETGAVFYRGLSGMCSPLALAIRALILNRLAFGLAGTAGVSAFGVFSSLSGICSVLGVGVCGTAGIVGDICFGERNRSSLKELSLRAAKLSQLLHTCAFAACFVLARPIALLFGTAEANLSFMIHAIRASMVCFLCCSMPMTALAIHRSLGHTILVAACTILDYCVFHCIFVFAFKGLLGPDALWYGALFSEVMTWLIFILYCKKTGGKTRLPFDFIHIPDSLAAPAEDCFDVTMRTVPEAEAVSQQVIDFLKAHGMDSRRSYFCGLCIEEQAVNIIRHGYTKGGDPDSFSIDLRLIYENGQARFTLKDNCKAFDPLSWCPRENETDPMKGIGIRMIQSLAKEISYHHTLGLNVLSVVI